jgi:hypothetical protein
MKNIFIFFFTLILFIGNIGIPVFTHACEEDGIFRSYFINTENHCENEQSDLPPCCQTEENEKDDCCHDETDLIQLKLDYSITWNQFHFTDYYFQTTETKAVYSSKVALSNTILTTNKGKDPPPKPWGKTLLIEQRVFRI